MTAEQVATSSGRGPGGVGRLLQSPTAKFSLGRLIPAALTVLSTPILARLVDRGDFGRLALLQTVGLLVGAACFGWLEVLFVRLFSAADEIRESDLSVVARPAIGAVVMVAGVGLVASLALESWLPGLTALCAVSYALTLSASAIARARGDALLFVSSTSVGFGARFVLGIPLIALGAGIDAVLLMWILGGLLASALAKRRLRLRWRAFHLPPINREHVSFAAPVVAVSTGLMILSLADRLILSIFLPPEDVAPYALGYSLVDQAASLGFSILLASRFPQMVRTFDEQGADAARVELNKSIERFLNMTVLPLLLLGLFGSHAAEIVGGTQYEGADYRYMPFVAIGLFLNGFQQYLSVPAQQRHTTSIWATALLLGVLVSLIVNFALIPSQGTLGAGIATLAGYGTIVLWMAYRQWDDLLLPSGAIVAQFVAVSAAAVTAATTHSLAWPASALIASVTYSTTVVVWSAVGRRTPADAKEWR